MAASDIVTLSGTIIQIASTIQETGNNWYRASADWKDLPRKVAKLQRQHEFWEAKFTQYGMSSDTSLIETLGEAKALLDEEQAKLSRRQAKCGAGLSLKVFMKKFPANIGLTMQRSIEGFDAILGQLEEENAVDVALETRVMEKAPTFTVPNDDRYVRLVTTESAVYSALEDREVRAGPSIVLLCGQPGKGKTTLARHAALRYQQTPNSTLFDRVVFLECGRKAEPSAKQFELWQLLRPTTGASEEQVQRIAESTVSLCKRLKRLLKDQKILIILDDIWREAFLQSMVELCGAGVKCLVTSFKRDLCRNLGFYATKIQIENVNEDVAMKIFASHAGFRNKQIPRKIKRVVKKMVKKTEGHPLALASIATAIDENRRDEPKEWEVASQNFLKLFLSEDNPHIRRHKYLRSFWSAMKLSFNSLKKDSLYLLILVHMCVGPTTPEEVLRILYLSVKFQDTSETFEKTRKDLESRELIKITSLKKQRLWSVHFLQKLFVEKEMRDLKESMWTRVALKNSESGVGSNELRVESNIISELPRVTNAIVHITVCAQYFDKDFAKRIPWTKDILHTRWWFWGRYQIEPITQLLGWSVSADWNVDAQSSAEQVFLQFVRNKVLHCEGILHLLELPISKLPTLSTLERVATVGGPHISNLQNLIKALVNLIEDQRTCNANIANAAARALQLLAQDRSHIETMISSGILEATVRILSCESHTDLQVILMNIFPCLGRIGEENVKIIVETPGALDVLVKSLCNANNAALQVAATEALESLANVEIAAHRLVHFPGVLEQLINLLFKVTMPRLQQKAARALGKLACEAEETILTVINSPKALEQLGKLLSQENNSINNKMKSPLQAAETLHILSKGMLFMEPAYVEYARQKFIETEGLMDGLLGSLANHLPKSTQGHAIVALTYLDPAQGNSACLHSAWAYSSRASANMVLGLNKESLRDLNKAHMMKAGSRLTRLNLMSFVTVQARLGDFQGALADANTAIETINQDPFHLQERGVVKRMIEDLPGALADLDKALDLGPDDYECLKHRGYVKFLMNDEEGARFDAEWALRVKPRRVDRPYYGHSCLGTTPVEFLDYKLR